MTRSILLTMLFTGCLGTDKPTSQPWYAQVPAAEFFIAQARYDSEGALHVMGINTNAIVHGVWDEDAGAYDWDAPLSLSVDGQPYNPFEAATLLDLNQVDMAIRPDTDEVWVWVNGMAGPLQADNTVDFTVRHPQDRTVTRGGLVFEDDTTLIVSQGDFADVDDVLRLTLSGDSASGTAETVMAAGSPLSAFCSAEIAGGLFRTQGCIDGGLVFRLSDGSLVGADPEDDDDIVLLRSATVGASDDFIIGRGLENAVCVGPASDDGRATITARRFANEASCYGVDVMAAPSFGGDIRDDGDQFMLFYANGASVVLDSSPPPTREQDLAGTWCNGVHSVSFGDDGEFVGVSGFSDSALFNDISYRYNGEVLTIDYKEPSAANFAWDGDARVRHWVVRAGDTLNAKSWTHEKYSTEGSGLSTLGGVYVPCE